MHEVDNMILYVVVRYMSEQVIEGVNNDVVSNSWSQLMQVSGR